MTVTLIYPAPSTENKGTGLSCFPRCFFYTHAQVVQKAKMPTMCRRRGPIGSVRSVQSGVKDWALGSNPALRIFKQAFSGGVA